MQAVVFIGYIAIAPPIHKNIFGLGHQGFRQNTQPLFRIRGDVAGDLLRQVWIANVVYPEAGIEVSQINPVIPILTIRISLGNMEIMGPKSAALFAEVFIGGARRWFGNGE